MNFLKDATYLKINTHAQRINSNSQDFFLEDFEVLLQAGIGIGQDFVWSSEMTMLPQTIPLEAIRDNIGEWSILAQRRSGAESEYLAFADHSGFGSLFYSLVPGRFVIISDSFQGVIRGLEANAIPRTLDLASFLAALHLTNVEFRTHFSSRTMAEDVRILRPGSLLHLSARSVSLLPRTLVGGSSEVSSYEVAMKNALRYAEDLLTQIPKLLPGGAYTHLSGGVDSRLILAMVSSFGLNAKYPVYSGDPRGVSNRASREVILNDVRIADMLRKQHSFEWWENRHQESAEIPFLTHLRAFQSFHSNMSFQYSPMQSRSSLVTPPSVVAWGRRGNVAHNWKSCEPFPPISKCNG